MHVAKFSEQRTGEFSPGNFLLLVIAALLLVCPAGIFACRKPSRLPPGALTEDNMAVLILL